MSFEELVLPFTVLAVGLVVGFLIVMISGKQSSDTAKAQGRTNDLDFAKKSTLTALRALEMEKDKLHDEEYKLERQSLLAHGAEAMRRLDESEAPTEEAPMQSDKPPQKNATALEVLEQNREAMGEEQYQAALAALKAGPKPKSGISQRWEGALWVLGIVAVIAAIYGVLSFGGDVKPKAQQAGTNTARSAPPLTFADQEKWEAALAEDPNNIEALNKMSWGEFKFKNDLKKAVEYNERARAIDAKNPDARFYHGLFLYLQRMPGLSFKVLDELLEEHPDHVDALELRGLFYIEEKRFDEGRTLVERAEKIAEDGQTRMRLRRLLSSIEQREAAFKENDKTIVSGTISLSGSVPDSVGQEGVIFISLRDPAGGPPVAAKKLPIGPFPLTFRVTGNDRIGMGGQRPVPDTFKLSIRMDGDGNAMSKEPGLPEFIAEQMTKGQEELAVTLEFKN